MCLNIDHSLWFGSYGLMVDGTNWMKATVYGHWAIKGSVYRVYNLHCANKKLTVNLSSFIWDVAAECFESAKEDLVLLFGLPPIAFLISNRLQCVIFQMKENRFLIKFLIYYFWVGVMPFDLWSNEFTPHNWGVTNGYYMKNIKYKYRKV